MWMVWKFIRKASERIRFVVRFSREAVGDRFVEARRSLRWVLSNMGKMVWAD